MTTFGGEEQRSLWGYEYYIDDRQGYYVKVDVSGDFSDFSKPSVTSVWIVNMITMTLVEMRRWLGGNSNKKNSIPRLIHP